MLVRGRVGDGVARQGAARRHRCGLGVGISGRAGVYDGCVGDIDRRDGSGRVIAAAGDVWFAAGWRAYSAGNGCVVALPSEPDLREPCRGDNVSCAGHSSGNLVGERSRCKSHAYRYRAMGGVVGGIGRHDPAVTKRLNIVGEKL
jgi:hypothetical protein